MLKATERENPDGAYSLTIIDLIIMRRFRLLYPAFNRLSRITWIGVEENLAEGALS
jgi:hypothetical protein